MTAAELVEEHGDDLIGRIVLTLPFGAWPGGRAQVKEILPDPKAPNIVLWVRGLDQPVRMAIKAGDLDDEEIGVFDDEEVELLADAATA